MFFIYWILNFWRNIVFSRITNFNFVNFYHLVQILNLFVNFLSFHIFNKSVNPLFQIFFNYRSHFVILCLLYFNFENSTLNLILTFRLLDFYYFEFLLNIFIRTLCFLIYKKRLYRLHSNFIIYSLRCLRFFGY